MDHHDHIRLLQDSVTGSGKWADLGSGRGAFTLALADLLGASGEIYSVDKDRNSLRDQQAAMRSRFPTISVSYLHADFRERLDLPSLDGIIMANSLHFVSARDKDAVIQVHQGYLKPGGRFVIVEYNVDQGNTWVPYPFSYPTWKALARRNGLMETKLLATRPTRFLNEIYSALSFQQG